MKQRTTGQLRRPRSLIARLGGLVALNGALLLLLAVVTLGQAADAQPMSRGEYTMVAGRAQGAQSNIVYIVDTVNLELIALTYDQNENQLRGIGYRNLGADARTLRAPGRTR
jgi:hypothetical protein